MRFPRSWNFRKSKSPEQSCEELFGGEVDDVQITYQGIIPGVTTKEELKEIMGEPEWIEPVYKDDFVGAVWSYGSIYISLGETRT